MFEPTPEMIERGLVAQERVAAAQERMAISQEIRTGLLHSLLEICKPVLILAGKEIIKSYEKNRRNKKS